jgi:hypothetical protein
MSSRFRLMTSVTGLLALFAAAVVSVSHAAPTSASGCARGDRLKTVFPSAVAVGFESRGRIIRQAARAPVWPGRCVGWWTTYFRRASTADVSVTLYKTSQDAIVALAEPAYGPPQVVPNGAHVRTLVGGDQTDVASVFRNVFISSIALCPCRSGDIRAQMHIHRSIDAAVQALG